MKNFNLKTFASFIFPPPTLHRKIVTQKHYFLRKNIFILHKSHRNVLLIVIKLFFE
jgi:hypothetical protein